MNTAWSAGITGAVTLTAYWLTSFVGEDYRRFRDGKALAAAMAGEIESIKIAMDVSGRIANDMLALLEKGHALPKQTMPEQPVSVYAANLERIGLLGTEVCRDLPFAYHMIHAYRVAMGVVFSSDDSGQQKGAMLVASKMAANANDTLPSLLQKLQARAAGRWRPFSP